MIFKFVAVVADVRKLWGDEGLGPVLSGGSFEGAGLGECATQGI